MWQFIKKHPLLIFMSAAFATLSLSLIVTSGRLTCQNDVCEIRFSEWQMHDSLWHISLAKLSFSEFPFRNPFYSGSNLSGYNYAIDLVLHALYRVGVDPFIGYFWILPIVATALYLYFSWVYLFKYASGSRLELYLTAFFLYFASSMSYLASLYATGTISSSTLRGFPVVTSLHPPSMLLNLPYAYSLSLILLLIIWLRSNERRLSSAALILWSFFAFGLKFYAGATGLLLLIFLSPKSSLVSRLLSFGLGSALAYLLFYNSGSGELPFAFAPLAIAHVLIDDIHLFYNHSLTLARYYLYENMSSLPIRLIAIEGLTVFLLFLVNWGVRGLTFFAPLWQPLSLFNSRVLLTSFILGLIPVFFVQSGGWYNTMQFMYYSILLLSLTTASVLSTLYHARPKVGLVAILLSTLLLLPTTLEQLRYPRLPHNVIGDNELRALHTLRDAPPGVVHVNRPWAKRALIPAIAEKEMYYLDTDQLMLFLPSYTERLAMVQKYDGGSINQIPADYYFIYKNEVASEDSVTALSRNVDLTIIFDSPEIIIYRRVDQVIQ